MESALLKRILSALVCFRYLVLFIRSFLPFTLPEVWRQTDTMGVALRYWLRWTVENPMPHPWLPAVLNSADGPGIMAMEFPLLNFFSAPFFALGPFWGRDFALLFYAIFSCLLVFWVSRLWRGIQILSVDAEVLVLLVPLISLGIEWHGKFMPDFVSVLLALAACGSAWRGQRRIVPAVLLALALLMKPTSVVVLGILFFHPERKKFLRQQILGAVSAGVVAGLYYTAGISYLRTLQNSTPMFFLVAAPPWERLAQLFGEKKELAQFFVTYAFFPYGIIPVAALIIAWKAKKIGGVFLLVALQGLVIGALAGSQALSHRYYFLGLVPALALIFAYCLQRIRSRWISLLLWGGLVIRLGEISYMDLRPLNPGTNPKWNAFGECRRLVENNPQVNWGQGAVFRSSDDRVPDLGLCFGERVGSATAPYGLYWTSDLIPVGCKTLAQEPHVRVVRCD